MHGYKDTWVLGLFGHRVHLLFDLHVGMIISILLFFHYLFSLGYSIYLTFVSIGYILYLILFDQCIGGTGVVLYSEYLVFNYLGDIQDT